MISDNHPFSLTDHLLSIQNAAYDAATCNPFLTKAGTGTLDGSVVCKWLVQDKYYQVGYVKFVSSLLSKLNLDDLVSNSPSNSVLKITKHGPRITQATLDILVDSLSAIKQEIHFYDHTVEKYNLVLEKVEMNLITFNYVELFEKAGKRDENFLLGLVVLWATEHCYLKAWTYAASLAKDKTLQPQLGEKGAIAALHREFIPNWTSEEFAGFVDKLATVTDAWAAELEGEERTEYDRVWERILHLEARFWPEV